MNVLTITLNFECWVIFLSSAHFFQNHLFRKILSEIWSGSQTVWIQVRLDKMSGLTWVQTVCKCYQQTTLLGKELIEEPPSLVLVKKNGPVALRVIRHTTTVSVLFWLSWCHLKQLIIMHVLQHCQKPSPCTKFPLNIHTHLFLIWRCPIYCII